MSDKTTTIKMFNPLSICWVAFWSLKLFAGFFVTWSWWWFFLPVVPCVVETVQWVAKH